MNNKTFALWLASQYQPSKASAKIRKIGYFWWGFQADVRMKNGKEFSSPDGSLLHAFSIVYELQQRGIDVYRLSINRDRDYVSNDLFNAFDAFSSQKRGSAYAKIKEPKYAIEFNAQNLEFPDVDVVLLEWRMSTRYNQLAQDDPEFEPDLLLQKAILEHYTAKGVPIVCLDLDYKMTEQDDKLFHFVFEPGFKRGKDHHIDVPYVLEDLNQFQQEKPRNEIVYIGNRYERDEAFDQFFGKDPGSSIEFKIFGNWLERGKDSQERWPHVKFHDRIQPYQIRDAYKYALCTPLLLKDEYNKNGFMSIRLIESLLFGTIPVLPDQFQSPFEYQLLRVKDETEMVELAENVLADETYRDIIRARALEGAQQHDVTYFVNKFLSVL